MAKKKKMNSTGILKILTFLFFVSLGSYNVSYELKYFGTISLTFYLYTIFTLLVSVPLHVFIHEVGHLLAGLATGYEFIMFRFFNQLWIYTENGLSKRKEYTPGVLGQALMIPPEVNENEKIPVLFYHMGGLILNGLTATLFVFVSFGLANPYTRYFFQLSAIVALFLLLTNAIPMKGTDGYNIRRYLKEDMQNNETTSVLYLYRDMIKGLSFKELQERIPVENLQDFSIPNTSTLYSLKASAYLEDYDFEKAHEINRTLWKNIDQLFEGHKADVTLNYLFTLFVTDPTHPDVEKIRKTNLYKSYRKIELADSYRLLASEMLYLENDLDKAEELLLLGENEIPFAPTVSDEKLERLLYDYLKKELALEKEAI